MLDNVRENRSIIVNVTATKQELEELREKIMEFDIGRVKWIDESFYHLGVDDVVAYLEILTEEWDKDFEELNNEWREEMAQKIVDEMKDTFDISFVEDYMDDYVYRVLDREIQSREIADAIGLDKLV